MADVAAPSVHEASLFVGIVLSSIIYGIYLFLFFFSIYTLRSSLHVTRFQRWFYIFYSIFLFILNTYYLASRALAGQMMWIGHDNDMRGDVAAWDYFQDTASLFAYYIAGSAAQILANLLVDAHLMYRCYVIFRGQLWSIVIPFLCAGCFPFFFIFSLVISKDSPNHTSLNIAMYATTIATNVILTAMISIRLIITRWRVYCAHCRRIHQQRSQQQQQQQEEDPPTSPAPGSSSTVVVSQEQWDIAAGPYTSISAILVESAALFCVFGVASCALDLANASIKFAIIILWTSACVVSSQLIILRIAMGDAWTNQTLTRLMHFSSSPHHHHHHNTSPSGPSNLEAGCSHHHHHDSDEENSGEPSSLSDKAKATTPALNHHRRPGTRFHQTGMAGTSKEINNTTFCDTHITFEFMGDVSIAGELQRTNPGEVDMDLLDEDEDDPDLVGIEMSQRRRPLPVTKGW